MLSELHLLIPWWKEQQTNLKKSWSSFTAERRKAVFGGLVLTGIAAIAGGTIFSFAMGGILVNSMFWWMISDEPNVMKWMKKKGHWVDILLTVSAFFGSGGVFSAWMTGMMATAYFTVFRKVLAPRPVSVPTTTEKKEAANAVA